MIRLTFIRVTAMSKFVANSLLLGLFKLVTITAQSSCIEYPLSLIILCSFFNKINYFPCVYFVNLQLFFFLSFKLTYFKTISCFSNWAVFKLASLRFFTDSVIFAFAFSNLFWYYILKEVCFLIGVLLNSPCS